jgi:hypothetical protein
MLSLGESNSRGWRRFRQRPRHSTSATSHRAAARRSNNTPPPSSYSSPSPSTVAFPWLLGPRSSRSSCPRRPHGRPVILGFRGRGRSAGCGTLGSACLTTLGEAGAAAAAAVIVGGSIFLGKGAKARFGHTVGVALETDPTALCCQEATKAH